MSADGLEERHDRERQPHPERAAAEREQEAFRGGLTEQRKAPDAQRAAHAVLGLTLKPAHQQQRRDISAGNQQHERRSAQQRQQDAAAVAVHFNPQRL